jgi:hypothetical protein
MKNDGTWDNSTSTDKSTAPPTANRTRSETGVNSRTSLVDKHNGLNAV